MHIARDPSSVSYARPTPGETKNTYPGQTSIPHFYLTRIACFFFYFTTHPRNPHLVASESGRPTAITLLSNAELDTLALGERDPGLILADDEDVALTGGELVVNGVLDVDDVEASVVALTVSDDTNTALDTALVDFLHRPEYTYHIASTSDHGDDTGIELDELGDLASGKVDLDGVVDLDSGIRVTDPRHPFSIYIPTSPKDLV